MRGTSGTDGKMETEGDREGWLEMNGTDDTNGSFETVGNADGVCRKRRLSRWGIVIRNGKTVGVAVGTNDWVGTQGLLWGAFGDLACPSAPYSELNSPKPSYWACRWVFPLDRGSASRKGCWRHSAGS